MLWEMCEIPLSAITTVNRHRKIQSAEDQSHSVARVSSVRNTIGCLHPIVANESRGIRAYWKENPWKGRRELSGKFGT